MRTVAVIFTDRRIPLSEVSSYKKYKFLCNYDIISPLDIIEDPRYTTKMYVVDITCDTDRVQQDAIKAAKILGDRVKNLFD